MLNTDKIGKNIKALRKAHGETQKELADSLHLSKNTISKYERGEKVGSGQKKSFDYDLLKQFSKHYNVPIKVLIEMNLSDFKFPDIFHQENPEVANLHKKIYPILKPKSNIESQEFYRAYYAHHKFLGITPNISDEEFELLIDDIFDGYEKSSDDTLISLINLVSFIILIESKLKISSQLSYKIKNRKLKQFSKINDSLKDEIEENLVDFEGLEGEIFEIFVKLKKKHFCTDLVDYLIALMYCNQLITNDLDETNSIIGIELMKTLVLLKNRYAIRYLKIICNMFDE